MVNKGFIKRDNGRDKRYVGQFDTSDLIPGWHHVTVLARIHMYTYARHASCKTIIEYLHVSSV